MDGRIVELRVEGSQPRFFEQCPPRAQLLSLVGVCRLFGMDLHEELAKGQVAIAEVANDLRQILELAAFAVDLR